MKTGMIVRKSSEMGGKYAKGTSSTLDQRPIDQWSW